MSDDIREPVADEDDEEPVWVLFKDGYEVCRFGSEEEAEEEAQIQFDDEKGEFESEGAWRRGRSIWSVEST